MRLLLLFALIVGSVNVWGVDVVYKTALFGSTYNSNSVGSYTDTWYSTTDGFRVDLKNFNNNNNEWDCVKCGRKNNASTATLITHAKIDKAVTKVALKIDAINTSKTTSIKLYTSSNGSSWTGAGNFDKSTGTKEVSLVTPTTNLYYKIEFVCTSGSSNGFNSISQIDYYVASSSPVITATDVPLAYNATEGEISYVLSNPEDGAELTADSDDEWISNVTVDKENSKVTFETEENEGATDREGTITIYYKKGEETLASKEVTITQGHFDLKDPVFSPAAGIYKATQSVELSCVTEGSAVYYTVDGTTPTTSSTLYSSAISVDQNTTIKAVSYKEGHYSNVVTANYIIDATLASQTWDLSKDETTSASESALTWSGTYASMTINKAESTTNANNYYPGTSGNTYTSTRFYKDSELTISPTSSVVIKSIVFTAKSNNYATVLKNSTWTNATAEADEEVVTITPVDGGSEISATISGTCGFTEVKVYYSTTENVTIGASKYASFCSSRNLDYSGTGVKVYTAKSTSSSVKLTEVKDGIVPANAGVVLYSETAHTYNIPVTSAAGSDYDAENNELIGINERTLVKYDGEGSKKNFILSKEDAGVGFYKATAAGAYLAAHRAYLSTGAAASRSFLGFDDETTGIESIDVSTENTNVAREYYNLNGQRVTTPTKGLYIVNGKKVIINK